MRYGKTRSQVKGIVAIEKGILRSPRVSDIWWRRFPKLSLRSGDATGHVCMDAINREQGHTQEERIGIG